MALICGLDECGRGPLAGHIVVAAALFEADLDALGPENSPVKNVKDSKKFSSDAARERVRDSLLSCSRLVDVRITMISADLIDKIGIDQANRSAFFAAVAALPQEPDLVLIDGVNPIHDWQGRQIHTPKGESIYWPIAAASIFAKVFRDQVMIAAGSQWPEYGFERNKGYGTPEHISAIKKNGPTEIHRKSFLTKILYGEKALRQL